MFTSSHKMTILTEKIWKAERLVARTTRGAGPHLYRDGRLVATFEQGFSKGVFLKGDLSVENLQRWSFCRTIIRPIPPSHRTLLAQVCFPQYFFLPQISRNFLPLFIISLSLSLSFVFLCKKINTRFCSSSFLFDYCFNSFSLLHFFRNFFTRINLKL